MSIEHVSASSIKLYEGCGKRWYFRYVIGDKEEATPAMELGTAVHSYLENYLLTGELPSTEEEAGKIAGAGIHLLVREPSPEVELSLEHLPVDGTPVPFKGFIDCLYKNTEEGIPEVLDHKTTSAWRYAKSPDALAEDTQMIIYAKHVLKHSTSDQIRLTHIAYLTKSPYGARRSSIVVSREHVDSKFASILSTVEAMLHTSKLTLEQQVKDEKQCYTYGKRCPYYSQCHATPIPNNNTSILGESQMSEKQKTALAKIRGAKKQTTLELIDNVAEVLADNADNADTADSAVESMVTAESMVSSSSTDSTTQDSNHGAEENNKMMSTLFVNCAIMKGEGLTQVSEKLAPIMQEIAEVKRVEHIGLVSFAEGWEMLNAYIIKNIPMDSLGDCYISSDSTLYMKCGSSLVSKFSRVVIAH